jgi:hypothetical protein
VIDFSVCALHSTGSSLISSNDIERCIDRNA